jgi:hypothetical protein
MIRLSRPAATGVYFAVGSVAMTVSTMVVVWLGNGGHPPLTIADAYIFFADWPMVLLHGSDFEIASGQSFLVNAIGWSVIGLLLGTWLYRRSGSVGADQAGEAGEQ